MMKNLLKTSVIVGFRSFVYPIYVLIGLAYGLMLLAFPEQYLPTMVPIFLLFEPGLVGFMFVGTEIFAEKKDGTISALAVTPIEWRSYILAKTIIMSVLSVIGAILIMAVGTRSLNGLPYVIAGVFLCSAVYTLLGIAISAKYRDLDDYFIPIMAVLVVSLLPFAHYHGYLTHPLWKVLYLVPSYPALYFFKAPFVEVSSDTLALSGVALLLWSAVAYYAAKIQFYKYAVEGLR
ncbi:ABC transporter permease [Thermococcus sp. JCM 11816]|uniref:fluoroquinolone export ABC transporter permease subunit n=1 Tax=Thermococcus sp. (strain JCM 11816 / KS-1) TaxID=1295125 RepID=UPI0006D268A7